MEVSGYIQNLLVIIGLTAVVLTAGGLVLLWWSHKRIRRLRIEPDTELGETLRKVPLGLMIALDLLDMGLDFLSAPFVWVFLDRMGWNKLRNLATAAAAVPGTQFLPVLTVSWIFARLFGKRAEAFLDAAQGKKESKRGSSEAP